MGSIAPLWAGQDRRAKRSLMGPLGPVLGGAAREKIATLADDFASADSAKWGYGNASIAVTSGQLAVTITASYPTLISQTTYDLTDSAAQVQVIADPNTGNGTVQAFFSVGSVIGSTECRFEINAGTLYANSRSAGVDNYRASVARGPTNQWLRISESGGTIAWETSADGYSWSTLTTLTNPFNPIAVSVGIGAGFYGTEPAPGTFVVDNFNTGPVPAGNAAATGAAGSPTATVGPAADYAAAAGTAQTPSVATSPNIPAGSAVGVGAAGAATVAVGGALAAAATGVGAAGQPSITATSTAAAGNAAGTGTSWTPAPNVSPAGGLAATTGVANQPTVKVAVAAGNAAGVGAARQATVSTTTSANAAAGVAAGVGAANAASASVRVAAGPSGTPARRDRRHRVRRLRGGAVRHADVDDQPRCLRHGRRDPTLRREHVRGLVGHVEGVPVGLGRHPRRPRPNHVCHVGAVGLHRHRDPVGLSARRHHRRHLRLLHHGLGDRRRRLGQALLSAVRARNERQLVPVGGGRQRQLRRPVRHGVAARPRHLHRRGRHQREVAVVGEHPVFGVDRAGGAVSRRLLC
jgi:hypothetical protein